MDAGEIDRTRRDAGPYAAVAGDAAPGDPAFSTVFESAMSNAAGGDLPLVTPAPPAAAAAPPAPGASAPPPVTADQLRAIMPNAGTAADTYADALNQAMAAHGITLPGQRAAFLAQISAESGDLRNTTENLNYAAPRLTQVWPTRFPTQAAAQPFAHNPQALGNHVYAGRLGNGDEASGDGYRFRGRGLIQVTGRDNYRALGYENTPDALAQPQDAANTAAAFWQSNNLNAATQAQLDRTGFDAVTRTVNGGDNGAEARWAAYQRAIAALAN